MYVTIYINPYAFTYILLPAQSHILSISLASSLYHSSCHFFLFLHVHVIDTPIAINFASFRKCVVVFVGVGVVDVFVTLVADLGADLEVDLHMCVGVQMFVGVHIGVHICV